MKVLYHLDKLHKSKLCSEFCLIDSRYPYEFNGGHIKSAQNLYLPEQISKKFFGGGQKRNEVIIFHCEFSSERGPNMLKFLRTLDRETNRYPTLDYPELYLLKDGYSVSVT